MFKRVVSMFLVTAIAGTIALSGCSKEQGKTEGTNAQTTKGSTERELVGNMYKTGLPIMKEPIELEAMVVQYAHIGPRDQMPLLEELEKKTNINIKWREVQSSVWTEKLNLMFASADYPDLMWRGVTDDQQLTYGKSGDIVKLNDLITQYAPNWVETFKKYPLAKKVSTAPDGSIYSLPLVWDIEHNSGMRDIWFINKQWLDKLGLKMPTTVNEYRDVLKAFKEKDPNGNGKADEIPWSFIFYGYVEGFFDMFSSFGTLDSIEHIALKDGKAVYTAITNESKETYKYLNSLYKDGLIDKEAITHNQSQFRAKTNADPMLVGSFSGYDGTVNVALDKITSGVYVPMPPLKGPNGEKPVWRRQTNTVERGYFTIFKKNKYPEATMRWANEIADKDFSLQILFGNFDKYIAKKPDGKYEVLPVDTTNMGKEVPVNTVSAVLLPETVAKINFDSSILQKYRKDAYNNVYKQYIIPESGMYPKVFFTKEQLTEKNKYEVDIAAYVRKTHAKWIVEGGIDQEWDEFVKKVKSMKIDDVMKIYQDAYETYMKN